LAQVGNGNSVKNLLVFALLSTAISSGLVLSPACRTEPSEYFVAVDGDDSNPGTLTAPFASLEAARDAVRARGQRRSLPHGGITVWLRGGTYERKASLDLTPADSGSPDAPITYRPYADEPARLIGGRLISGFEPVSEPAALARLREEVRSHVLAVNLHSLGIADFGELRSRGFGRPISPAHLELFFGNRPMTLARWPNEGEWEKIASFPPRAARDDGHGQKIGDLKAGFRYSGDRPVLWKKTDDLWIHGYWAWDWANSYEWVESLDIPTRLIKTAPPYGLYGFRPGQRYYFLNVLEELDAPGEWYLDHQTGVLYFWPPAPIESGEVMVSLLEDPLISVDGASDVIIQGLILEGTRGHGIVIKGGERNLVAGCNLRNIGNYGIRIEGGHDHSVLSCDITETGDGGVSLAGGDRLVLEPAGHSVANSHFSRQGRWSKCYVPAVLISGVGMRAANNLIHDHPHCAILYSGNDHRIEFNEIHHIALETGDVGAIYSGRDWTYRGNVIRHNFIHETGGVGMGSMGVYMDDCVSGTEIFGNVFYKVQRAVFLGGGRDHNVENNVFVDCQPSIQVDGRGLDKSPVWHNMVYEFMKNQRLALPQDLYRRRYPAIGAVDPYYLADDGIPPEGNIIIRNISVGGPWLIVGWNATMEMLEVRDNFIDQDPGFINPEKLDFRLKQDSPAWAIGFKPIPFNNIGLYRDEYRTQLN
jgi:hypothetical protein